MFLPLTKAELLDTGVSIPDFIIVAGDDYVDHPSFGHAVIGRLLESQGFSVGLICRPKADADYREYGAPRIAFMIASGVVDSMVNNYTAAKKRRSDDDYAEKGQGGGRPDRALTVYAKAVKRIYPDSFVIVGGIEASLRRFAHYDYWSDSVMPSVLKSAGADMLVFGMGEKPVLELCASLKKHVPIAKLRRIRGTAVLGTQAEAEKLTAESGYFMLSSFARVSADKETYARTFHTIEQNADSTGAGLIQKQTDNAQFARHNAQLKGIGDREQGIGIECQLGSSGQWSVVGDQLKDKTEEEWPPEKDQDRNCALQNEYLICNPPAVLLTTAELDSVYELPYHRDYHPSYTDGVPSLEEVKFSLVSHRGCFCDCSFCALTMHQGREIVRRSPESVLREAELLIKKPDFKGYIHDLGGPSANLRVPACGKQGEKGPCRDKQCIGFAKCPNLKASHAEYLNLLRALRKLPGVKKVFIRSGIRFDYLMYDADKTAFREIVRHHISGQLKVAPEHVSDNVLKVMNKAPHALYEKFAAEFQRLTAEAGLPQFLVPYFISSHPGSTLADAVELAVYLKRIRYNPQQVQDFYPTPGTRATCMFHTGLDPDTMRPVFVEKSAEGKAMQRALLQFNDPKNRGLVRKALIAAGRGDLIGKLVK
ncbi:hypothetical protein FACS1894211_01520 [Clostridia bacterium]|nr:hypothetical protein FACS1894211_01520 [Clostridia bacterium]